MEMWQLQLDSLDCGPLGKTVVAVSTDDSGALSPAGTIKTVSNHRR